MGDDERDLERALEEHARRIFNAPTEQERKKAERELAEHIARPKLTDDLDQLAREFEIRLKRAATLLPDTPAEYRVAFAPFLDRMATIPPHDKWTVEPWDLWTQHMVKFSFAYGVEPLCAMLGLKVFGLINPSPEIFEELTSDPDEIERARKTREFVERVEADVVSCVQLAFKYFLEALRGRLGAVLDQTLHEIAIRAISEIEQELNNPGEKNTPRLRKFVLNEWARVEKVRLGMPTPGAPTFGTKEEVEALIDEAQEKLKPLKMDQNKNAVRQYINANYPAVRCSSGQQLNRLLKKFGLEWKFQKIEQIEQNSK
jgi:hypothetical protein